ncbi:hypothetical protein VNO80_06033 [Phaseolus coccineus]|uniref:Uncharacterized protein n=1 Tax=Phaseolus coccineus TaxID=3886 RepID=A0AAN9NGS4_PHACN
MIWLHELVPSIYSLDCMFHLQSLVQSQKEEKSDQKPIYSSVKKKLIYSSLFNTWFPRKRSAYVNPFELIAKAVMEWCDHCCRFCQTSVGSIMNDFAAKYCSSCTMCGKILLDSTIPLQLISPNLGINRISRTIRKRRKKSVQIVNKECK